MTSVINALRNRHYNVEKVMIYYYTETNNLYVYCGKATEIAEDVMIQPEDILEGKSIRLRFRHIDIEENRSTILSTP